MRFSFVLIFCAFALAGCEGMKVGAGYNMEAKQFFLQIERPLDKSLQK
jgi:hypothetical protein